MLLFIEKCYLILATPFLNFYHELETGLALDIKNNILIHVQNMNTCTQ